MRIARPTEPPNVASHGSNAEHVTRLGGLSRYSTDNAAVVAIAVPVVCWIAVTSPARRKVGMVSGSASEFVPSASPSIAMK